MLFWMVDVSLAPSIIFRETIDTNILQGRFLNLVRTSVLQKGLNVGFGNAHTTELGLHNENAHLTRAWENACLSSDRLNNIVGRSPHLLASSLPLGKSKPHYRQYMGMTTARVQV